MAAGRVVGDEILEVAPVVEQSLRAQLLDQLVDQSCVEPLVPQLAAQLAGGVVAPRQGIERRNACRPRIERLYRAAASDARTSFSPRFMVAFSGISLARI